jgi:cysteine desulfurase
MARVKLDASHQKMKQLRDSLQKQLLDKIPYSLVRVNGHPEERLPNTLSISFKGIKAPTLLAQIQHRLACSAGSACHATEEGEAVHASYVLQAMEVPTEFALGTLRLSVGRFTTQPEVDEAAAIVSAAVIRLGGANQVGYKRN